MNIEQEANDKWIVQAFNGTPLLLIPCGGSGFDLDELFGEKFQKFIYEFKDDQGRMFYHVNNLEKLRDKLLEKIKRDKTFLNKLKEQYTTSYNQSFTIAVNITSDKVLIELLKKAAHTLRMSVGLAHIIEPFALTMDDEIKKKLSKYCNDAKGLNTRLSLLSAPTEKSFISEKEEDLHRISLFPPEKREEEIKKHIQKFHWARNSYAGRTVMTEHDVKNELTTLKFNKIDTEKGEENFKREKETKTFH